MPIFISPFCDVLRLLFVYILDFQYFPVCIIRMRLHVKMGHELQPNNVFY